LPLFGLLAVLIDAQAPDLRFQCLPWNTEFCGCAGRSGYAAVAIGESSRDHLHFTIGQRRNPKSFERPGPKSVSPAMNCSGVEVVVCLMWIVGTRVPCSVFESGRRIGCGRHGLFSCPSQRLPDCDSGVPAMVKYASPSPFVSR